MNTKLEDQTPGPGAMAATLGCLAIGVVITLFIGIIIYLDAICTAFANWLLR